MASPAAPATPSAAACLASDSAFSPSVTCFCAAYSWLSAFFSCSFTASSSVADSASIFS